MDDPAVGRMVPRKGVDNAIRAFARLQARHGISARLLIVGGETAPARSANDAGVGKAGAIGRLPKECVTM